MSPFDCMKPVCALLLSAYVAAQGPLATWKQKNELENRYEGVGFERQVGTPGVELLGMIDEASSFTTDGATSLSVDFFAMNPAEAVVIARELVISEYYWMESKPFPAKSTLNTFAPWSTDVLRRHSTLRPDNIGVLVRLAPRATPIRVAPALVRNSPTPIQQSNRYHTTFLPETLLSKVTYTLRAECGTTGKTLKAGRLGRQYAQIPFAVTFDLSKESTGMVTLRLDYTRTDGDAYFEVCFPHVQAGRGPGG